MESSRHYHHDVTVRYSETDQMGVVHHANFLLYFEDARTAMMRSFGLPYGELEKTGVGLPVRNLDVRYRTPALYEDQLLVLVWIKSYRAASMTFGYTIERATPEGKDTIASATIELACIDLTTKKPRVFPDEVRRFLREFGLA